MDTVNNYKDKKRSENISRLSEQKEEISNRYRQYRDVYETMDTKLRKYSSKDKSMHKSNILKVIDAYEQRTEDIQNLIDELKNTADFSVKDMSLQTRVDDLCMPLEMDEEGMEKSLSQLENAVSVYNKYKGMLDAKNDDSTAEKYKNQTALFNILRNTQKMTPKEYESAALFGAATEESINEYVLQKAVISDLENTDNAKVFLIKQQEEQLERNMHLDDSSVTGQKLQKETEGLDAAVQECIEKKDVLQQAAKLSDRSKGAEKEDPDYTLVLQKAAEYISKKNSQQNITDLLDTMNAVGAYIEKHRHAVLGKNHTRRNMMEDLQKKLLACVNATMKLWGTDHEEPHGMGEVMKQLNDTFCEDGGSAEFIDVIKNMNIMRMSGNYKYAGVVQPIVRKYIASHGSPHMAMGKKRLKLMKQLETELAMYAGTNDIQADELDNELIKQEEMYDPVKEKKEKAVYSEKCQKNIPAFEKNADDFETRILSQAKSMSPAKYIYGRMNELKEKIMSGSAGIDDVNSLYNITRVALETETVKYKTINRLDSKVDYSKTSISRNVNLDVDYLSESVAFLKSTLSILRSLGARKADISNDEINERANGMGWYGPDYYSFVNELKNTIKKQKAGK